MPSERINAAVVLVPAVPPSLCNHHTLEMCSALSPVGSSQTAVVKTIEIPSVGRSPRVPTLRVLTRSLFRLPTADGESRTERRHPAATPVAKGASAHRIRLDRFHAR